MRIDLVAIGRMKSGPERDLVARYLERAVATGRGLGLTGFAVSERAESRASGAESRKAEEAKDLGEAIAEGAVRVVLDERGRSPTSEDFAAQLVKWRDAGRPAVAFVIGGADGLDHAFMDAADRRLGFSALTWPHQLVRIMLAEQLYRATTILSGHPYHRGQ